MSDLRLSDLNEAYHWPVSQRPTPQEWADHLRAESAATDARCEAEPAAFERRHGVQWAEPAPQETEPRGWRDVQESLSLTLIALLCLFLANGLARQIPLWAYHVAGTIVLWMASLAALFLAPLLWQSRRKVWGKDQ